MEEQEKEVQHPEATNQERHVEELAGPDDYWLTITDAARATRRQDVSIRRWISKGLLPVRRQHVGLNQRTRLVRASDLAALTPIIDPAGAISSERGKLDLTSIPVQQAQIKMSQQEILTRLEYLQGQLQELSRATQQQFAEQQQKQQEAHAFLRNEIAKSAIRQQDALVQHRKELDNTLCQMKDEWGQHLQQLASETVSQLTQLTDQIGSIRQDVETLTLLWQEKAALQQDELDRLAAHGRQQAEQLTSIDARTRQQEEQLSVLKAALQQEMTQREELAQRTLHLLTQQAQQQARYEGLVEQQGLVERQINQFMAQLARLRDEQRLEAQVRDFLQKQVEQLAIRLNGLQSGLQR